MASRLFLLIKKIAFRRYKARPAALISRGAPPRHGGLVASCDQNFIILTLGKQNPAMDEKDIGKSLSLLLTVLNNGRINKRGRGTVIDLEMLV